jgi:hypothetical protein
MNKLSKRIIIFVTLVLLSASCNQKPQNNQEQTEQISRKQIQVVQKVQGQFGDKLFNFYADENKTALDLLKMSYKVDIKTFSGAGEFVTSIAGVESDAKHSWEFFLNGNISNVGAWQYKPINGDKIEWKFTDIK